MNKGKLLLPLLVIASFILMLIALWAIFIYVPTERMMGVVQRIFYFHVPVAWLALVSYGVVFVGSIAYLVKRKSGWDNLASAAGEIGFLFTSLFLISGSLWAKPAWGAWWVWTPRLTSGLILWFIYVAYLMVRSFSDEEQRGARYGAVVGIIGFIDVPIVILSVSIWSGQHPGALIFEGGLEPAMLLTLQLSLLAFTVLYGIMLYIRTSIKNRETEIKQIREQLG